MELLQVQLSLSAVLISFFSALTVSYLTVQSFTYRYEYSDILSRSFAIARNVIGTVSFLGVFVLMVFILS